MRCIFVKEARYLQEASYRNVSCPGKAVTAVANSKRAWSAVIDDPAPRASVRRSGLERPLRVGPRRLYPARPTAALGSVRLITEEIQLVSGLVVARRCLWKITTPPPPSTRR